MSNSIENRLTFLERSNRRYRTGAIVLGSLGAVLLAGGAAQPENVPAIMRSQRFEIVSPSGEKVVEFAFNSELGCGEITTFSTDGTKRVRLGGEKVQSNGAVEIFGKTGITLAALYASDETGSGFVAVNNAAGKGIHYFYGDKEGNARSTALNRSGKTVYTLACTPKEAGWLKLHGADGTALVQGGGANEDGNGVLMIARGNGKPAAELKGYSEHTLLSLFDGLGQVRTRVASTTPHGGRIGVYTAAGKPWAYWPERAEIPSGGSVTGPDVVDTILDGAKK